MFFSSDPAVSSSIFVGAEREELIRNDPDKNEFTIKIKPDFPSTPSDVLRTNSLSLTTGRVKHCFSRILLQKEKHVVGWPPKTMRNLSIGYLWRISYKLPCCSFGKQMNSREATAIILLKTFRSIVRQEYYMDNKNRQTLLTFIHQ